MADSLSPAIPEAVASPVQVDDLLTLCAIGVLASIATALGHELLGHAAACVLTGGEVSLLSVIWFRCSPASAFVSLAGPVGSLAVAIVGSACSIAAPRQAIRAQLFGLVLAALALFWFFGQLISDALSRGDDWGGAASAANWPQTWRIAALLIGLAGYAISVRLIWLRAARLRRGGSDPRRFLTPWIVGALAVVACASMRPNDGSAMETIWALVIAPFGYVWAVTRGSVDQVSFAPVARSWSWLGAGVVALFTFGAVFGPGVGRLA